MRGNEQNNTEYVTSSVGMRILGVERGTFFYHVDKKDIEVEPGGTKRKNRYKLADILRLKEERKRARIERAQKKLGPPALIDWIYDADLPAGIRLALQRYDLQTVNLAEQAIYQSWRQNNPYLTLGAYSQDRSECFASVQLVPLVDEQIALDVLSNRREENSIRPDEIPAYDKPGPYILLATSAICLPSRPELLYRLLVQYMKFWEGQYPTRYMRKIYAQAMSESGYKLAQHLFMAPRPDLAYNAYELDLARPSASRLIDQFKQRLANIAPLPPDLRWPPVVPPHVQVAPAQATHAPPPVTPSEPRTTSSKPRSQKEPLPGDYVACERFAKDHGISPSTMRKAVASGRLRAEENDWIAGKAPVRSAFNREQQAAFIAMYQTNEHYHQCDNQNCPCQFDTP